MPESLAHLAGSACHAAVCPVSKEHKFDTSPGLPSLPAQPSAQVAVTTAPWHHGVECGFHANSHVTGAVDCRSAAVG